MNTIDQIKKLLDSVDISSKIGVAITTHNRYDIFKKTYDEISKFLPSGAVLVIVDDASSTPVKESTFRFDENVGIARSKNKCFELLYDAGCEHFFLFDDDCYPLVEDWHKPYIESREPHLNYIFTSFKGSKQAVDNNVLLYTDWEINAYSHPRGCMCYFKRVCLDKVGGMHPVFGKWGYEHPDLSNRIYNAGLTSFRYMDVVGSDKLIYSHDEHTFNKDSTITIDERKQCVSINEPIGESRKNIIEYVDFREKKNILLTSYFTTVKDTQGGKGSGRKEYFTPDKKAIQPLINSMGGEALIVLNDCFDDEKIGNVTYKQVEASINPYFQRWLSYYRYLIANKDQLNFVFMTDATDVQMQFNPFYRMQKGRLYVGDEHLHLGYEWIVNNHPHKDIQEFIKSNRDLVVLNAGLLGGDIETVLLFLRKLLSFYFQSIVDDKTKRGIFDCGTTDMGAFNYVLRTEFSDIIVHGTQVNTVFKEEKSNSVSWFKHK